MLQLFHTLEAKPMGKISLLKRYLEAGPVDTVSQSQNLGAEAGGCPESSRKVRFYLIEYFFKKIGDRY